jgi:hypothetical protein
MAFSDDWFVSIVLISTVAVWEVSKALLLGLCSRRRKLPAVCEADTCQTDGVPVNKAPAEADKRQTDGTSVNKAPAIKTEQIAKQSAKQTAKHECTDTIWIAPEQGERYHASAACNGLRFAAAKQEYLKCKLCFKKTA